MKRTVYEFINLTAIPGALSSYFTTGVVGRAVRNKIIKFTEINLHDFGLGRYGAIDDKPYGGGPGMVMRIEPIFKALQKIKRTTKTRIILLAASGKQFSQNDARRYVTKYNQLIFINGRYEGVDARVKNLVDEVVSIGPYILSGGELATTVIIDSVSRLIPGVLGEQESLVNESFNKKTLKEHPHYTRPETFYPQKNIGWRVPKILLSGNHKKIQSWRDKYSLTK